jgi:mannose-6-phosphate isomerase
MVAVEEVASVRAAVEQAHRRLLRWLLNEAYPLWSTRGIDVARGGFHESLSLTGEPLDEPRRARVQPRQIFAFSQAPRLGWGGDSAHAMTHGLTYLLSCYRRPDGLFRTLVSPDGVPRDHRAVLYDQAFALLAFAVASPLLGMTFDLRGEGERLRVAVNRRFRRRAGGFSSRTPHSAPLQSNPHMHLLEAALAWSQASGESVWRELADEIVHLALTHFIDPVTGALRESFDDSWAPVPSREGRFVEPGHQFEWAWLLMSWKGSESEAACQAAMRLMELGERYGVQRGIAVNALLDDFSVHDAAARLWPQTERLRAAALAARLFGETRYWRMASEAAVGLMKYLSAPVPGLWHDQISRSGELMDGPVPAGNLYHIVGAILELDTLLAEK